MREAGARFTLRPHTTRHLAKRRCSERPRHSTTTEVGHGEQVRDAGCAHRVGAGGAQGAGACVAGHRDAALRALRRDHRARHAADQGEQPGRGAGLLAGRTGNARVPGGRRAARGGAARHGAHGAAAGAVRAADGRAALLCGAGDGRGRRAAAAAAGQPGRGARAGGGHDRERQDRAGARAAAVAGHAQPSGAAADGVDRPEGPRAGRAGRPAARLAGSRRRAGPGGGRRPC